MQRLKGGWKTNKNDSKESPLLIITTTKVAQALLIKQNKQKTEGEITIAPQEAAQGGEVASVGNLGY